MTVSMLVAAAENDVIGDDGRIPWRLPADMRRFAAMTSGHPVVMGRLTYDSIIGKLGRPLPGRHSVVISQRSGVPAASVTWVASPSAAAEVAESLCQHLERGEWFVIGGASIYRQMLTYVDAIHLTRVHAHVTGDRAMPSGWLDGFRQVTAERVIDAAADLSYSFVHLGRTGAGRSGADRASSR
jgi:dihydrofolate reductase